VLVALEIHDTDFLLVTATDATRGDTAVMIAPAGLLANLDQRFLRLRLSNVAKVRDRNVSRGRRQRSKCSNWHNKKFYQQLRSRQAIIPVSWWNPVIGLQTCCPLIFRSNGAGKLSDPKTFASGILIFFGMLL
jgi:hypothetical protein